MPLDPSFWTEPNTKHSKTPIGAEHHRVDMGRSSNHDNKPNIQQFPRFDLKSPIRPNDIMVSVDVWADLMKGIVDDIKDSDTPKD